MRQNIVLVLSAGTLHQECQDRQSGKSMDIWRPVIPAFDAWFRYTAYRYQVNSVFIKDRLNRNSRTYSRCTVGTIRQCETSQIRRSLTWQQFLCGTKCKDESNSLASRNRSAVILVRWDMTKFFPRQSLKIFEYGPDFWGPHDVVITDGPSMA